MLNCPTLTLKSDLDRPKSFSTIIVGHLTSGGTHWPKVCIQPKKSVAELCRIMHFLRDCSGLYGDSGLCGIIRRFFFYVLKISKYMKNIKTTYIPHRPR